MKKLNGRELKALFVLSIVVPLGLLTTLRLIGLLPEPLKLESFAVEAVEWKLERPSGTIGIMESVENSYRDGNASVVFKIFVDDYHRDMGEYGGSDLTSMNVTGTANVSNGFVESIRVVFREEFKSSEVWIYGDPDAIRHFYRMKNLSVSDLAGRGWFEWKLENNTKAFFTLVGVNKPSSVYFNVPAHWVLRSESNQSHKMAASLELTYRNSRAYKKVVLPINLSLFIDNNDSFETAEEIHEGNYPKLFLGSDDRDFYKIYANQGQRIEVHVNGLSWSGPIFNGTAFLWPIWNGTGWSWLAYNEYDWSWTTNPAPDFDLYIYDPERNLVVATESPTPTYFEVFDVVADSTGFWFIEIRNFNNYGFYSLGVNK